MATACGKRNIHGHPCFGGGHHGTGRIHLPVAPRCNIKCRYCTRRHDCANESRPGVASRILTPEEAVQRVREVMASPLLGPSMKVAGIAGPGDPLANGETFETFRLVGEEFPQLLKCLSTNGLLLPDSIDELATVGVGSITVTMNALDPGVAGRIVSHIAWGGKTVRGTEAGEILGANQQEGIRRAARLGMMVKVNTVLIPGINDGEVPRVAARVKELGADIMNVIPLIPQADFAGIPAPDPGLIEEVRAANEKIIGQMRHCRQCRADAVGILGGSA